MTTRSESPSLEATTSLAPLAPEGIESLPTFFELYAAERLVGTLQDAMSYALSVYGQRSAFCRRLLDRQDEFFFLLRVLLENATLRSSHASFSEAVYGMRRVAQSKSSGRSAQGLPTVLTPAVLTPAQRRLSLMLLTLAPFLKAKLLAMHKSIMSEELGERRDGEETDASAAMLPLLRRGQYSQAAKALSRRVFPGAYIMAEGVNLCYKFAYLVQLSPYYSPLLHVLGLRVTRVSPQDAAALREAKDATRHAQLASCSMLGQLYLKSRYFLNDHATSFIIVLVFAFKVVEWWYTSAEERLATNHGKRVVPPPPPAMAPSKDAMYTLPKDPRVCPICRQKIVNPAMVSRTGIVSCYRCLFLHIEQHSSCPVTGRGGVTKHDVRRLISG